MYTQPSPGQDIATATEALSVPGEDNRGYRARRNGVRSLVSCSAHGLRCHCDLTGDVPAYVASVHYDAVNRQIMDPATI